MLGQFLEVPLFSGSLWIYEVPAPKGGVRIYNREDFIYGVPEGLLGKMKVSEEWYSREMSLQTATMMLWIISGVGGEPFEGIAKPLLESGKPESDVRPPHEKKTH